MRKMLIGSLFAIVLGAGALLAGDGHGKHDQTPTTAPSAAAAAPVNHHCPVMSDEKVNPKVTIQHEGKTIAFCCNECIPEFKKDPAKYMKDLK